MKGKIWKRWSYRDSLLRSRHSLRLLNFLDGELGIVHDVGLESGSSTPFDFLTGESLSREVSDEGEDMEEMGLQRFTAEVQALT